MAENPFRILLDFRELNFKFYKFVWMSISPREILTIKDLKDALLKKFSFERTDLLLFLRDGLLPDDENISNILRENDSVRLFYAGPSNVNLSDTRTISNERDEEIPNLQETSTRKRKEHSDASEDGNGETESSKKRKHSFSNGTYLFNNNSTLENPALKSAVSDDTENVSFSNLFNSGNSKSSKSGKIKKKLKYSHDVSQNSLGSGNEIALSSDIIPMSEKNQSKINSCKKKKKHKHSKDVSESELILFDNATMSEINENKSRSRKKKRKPKHSLDASQIPSMPESAVSFQDETTGTAKKWKNSTSNLKTRNELSEIQESIFHTVTDDSEVLTVPPNSFSASSVTTSGIGYSLKTSQGSNKKTSSETNSSKSPVSCSQPFQEAEENLSVSQGNNCKKKKRKRHRKKKSLLISPQVDVSNDCNFNITSPPKKIENLDSHFTSPSYQTSENSPRNKETSDNSKSNVLYFKRNANCLEAKSFMEPFGNYLPSTSTPFLQTHAVSSASPRKKIVTKTLGSSNASEYQSCSVKAYMNTVLPAIQKEMIQSFLSTHSTPYNILPKDNKKNAPTPNHNSYDKGLSNKKNSEKNCDPNKKDLSVHSSPCSATNYKSNATTLNGNSHSKSLSNEKNSSDKSADSTANIGIKSRFLDPSFSYKGCPPLNSCPLVGSRIAYKVLELDSSYSPVVSNYKEGVVKAINPQTDELEIELIQPEVKEGRIGKFENIYEDEEPTCEVIRKVTVSWPSLIDPVQVIY